MRLREHLARALFWIDWRFARLVDSFEQRFLDEDEQERMSDMRIDVYNAWADMKNKEATERGAP